MSILSRGGEDPHDAPAVGVNPVINLRPDCDVVVRVVPWEP